MARLVDLGRLIAVDGRLSGGCGEVVWRMGRGCLEGMVMLSGAYGEAVWRVWGGCLEGVGRLSRGCGEAVQRV